ncbi:hypothetical protein ABHN05_13025 [Brevibacillus laterosporus]|uniref:AbiTii domain-containing protein n=1 Tax=Brevibacillus laterosporus TaxID=1465 RepID=UPI00112CDA11|nr:hypothetical protein [Brevibacillus laterosporus]MED4762118.1 hypothetical protein [Brevibacillus laterosporus]TPH09977.1 hypothetical protein EGH09_21725 [Brevibacillus laterosporus]
MESIVLELQREAYQNNTSVSNLLRKAYTLSKKLKVREFETWADWELNGYEDSSDLPEYRKVYGELKAFNPYNGYIPAYLPDLQDLLTKKSIFEPITEIETVVRQGNENKGRLMFTFPTKVQQDLMAMMEYPFELSLHIQTSQFQRILDRVRNIILEWTLKLEEEGVFGKGMTFTDNEKKKAINSMAPMYTFIGNMTNSQIQQNTTNSTQTLSIDEFKIDDIKSLIGDLREFHKEIGNSMKKDELLSEIEVLEAQAKSPNPKKGIISETLKSIRNIAEGITGSLLATAIQEKINLILPTFGA